MIKPRVLEVACTNRRASVAVSTTGRRCTAFAATTSFSHGKSIFNTSRYKKQQRRLGLILRGRRLAALARQMRQKVARRFCSEFLRMPLAVEQKVAPRPVQRGLLGVQTVMPQANFGAHAVEASGRRLRNRMHFHPQNLRPGCKQGQRGRCQS